MKKFVASIILILMFYNLVGYYIFYFVMTVNVKKEVSDLTSSTVNIPLTIIELKLKNGKIDDNDFEFVNDNEIIYKGHMYDVLRTEHGKENILLYCYNDKRDEVLRNYFYTHLSQNSSKDSKSKFLSRSKVKKCVTPEITYSNLIRIYQTDYFIPEHSTPTSEKAVESPPPKIS